MATVLFIGGPLDGQTRVVADGHTYVQCRRPEVSLEMFRDRAFPVEDATFTYYVANGIARAEDVTEEQVAQRLHAVYAPTNQSILDQAGVEADQLLENGWDRTSALVRKLARLAANRKPQQDELRFRPHMDFGLGTMALRQPKVILTNHS